MTSSQSNNMACAHCKELNASKFCAGCNGSPDPEGEPQKTAYCNSACQTSHWQAHKADCLASRQRKILFRAGEMAQKLLYLFRWQIFEKRFEKVEYEGHDIMLYEDCYEDDREFSPAQAMEKCLVPFQARLFKEERDILAVLAYNACGDAMYFIDEPLSAMLKGICKSIQEEDVFIKNRKRRVNLIVPVPGYDTEILQHGVLRVELKCGETYAVDISGAQHGHYQAITPWEYYVRTRVDKFGNPSKPFGHGKDYHKLEKDHSGCTLAILRIDRLWAKKLAEYVRATEADMPLAKMLKMSDGDFQLAQQKFIMGTLDYLEGLKDRFQAQGAISFYKTEFVDQGLALTLTPSEWDELQGLPESASNTQAQSPLDHKDLLDRLGITNDPTVLDMRSSGVEEEIERFIGQFGHLV